MKHRTALVLGVAAAALAVPASANAALIARADAGADTAAITDVRDAVRAELGGGDVAGANGSFGGVRREINWDGTPDQFSEPNLLPPNFFNSNSPRGAEFAAPGGTGVAVSADDDNPTGNPLRFGLTDPSYVTSFTTFSPQRLFRSVGTNITDVRFFVPGTQTPATTKGFAVIFTDVDEASSTKLEAFDSRDRLIGTVFAPPADQGLSIASLVSDTGAPISRVRITSGTTALGPGVVDVPGSVDVVAMDDFIYGEPQAASDLAVTVTDAPDPARAEKDLTYTVTVQNAGGGAAPSADLTAVLPAGVSAVSATPSQGTCQTVTSCQLGSLAAGASATVTIVARPAKAGTVQASFTAIAPNDTNAGNDTATAETTVRAADRRAQKVVIRSTSITVPRNGNVALRLYCPGGEERCTGTVRMTTKLLSIGGRKLRLDLGYKRFTMRGGRVTTATIKLRPAERTLLRALRQIRVDVAVDAADAAGNRSTSQKAVWLKARR